MLRTSSSSGTGAEDDVGGLRDLARGVAPAQTFVRKVLRVVGVERFAVHRVSGAEEPGGHVAAHVSESDEAERGHDQCLPSMS
jgi:hypothetical protein